jgi:transposase
MSSTKYIGMDVHTESISIAVRNSVGKLVMECVIETKASTIVQFIDGLRGDLRVTFEEGTWAAWLYDLLKPHVTEVLVCNTRKNTSRNGSKSDRIDARKLSEQLYMTTGVRNDRPQRRYSGLLTGLRDNGLQGVVL